MSQSQPSFLELYHPIKAIQIFGKVPATHPSALRTTRAMAGYLPDSEPPGCPDWDSPNMNELDDQYLNMRCTRRRSYANPSPQPTPPRRVGVAAAEALDLDTIPETGANFPIDDSLEELEPAEEGCIRLLTRTWASFVGTRVAPSTSTSASSRSPRQSWRGGLRTALMEPGLRDGGRLSRTSGRTASPCSSPR